MSFQNFILKQLKLAGVAKEHRLPIYKNNKDIFVKAFIHKSFQKEEFNNINQVNNILKPYDITINTLNDMDNFGNNELFEFNGDIYLKAVHGKILADSYPHLITKAQGDLTFAFQKLISERIYAKEAERLGFFQFLLTSNIVKEQAIHWKNEDIKKVDMMVVKKYWRKGERENVYFKLLEDAFEAFACALVTSVDKYTDSIFGPGMGMLYRWGLPIMNFLTFDPADITQTKHPGMVLKELWEDIYADKFLSGFKVTKQNIFKIGQDKKIGYIPIEAIDPITRAVIAKTIGATEQEARKKASEIAIKYLQKWRADDIEKGKEYKKTMLQK